MHEPVRELLKRQDVKALDVPTEPRPTPRYARWMVALERFSPQTQHWFTQAFEAPTPAQEQGWEAISKGSHALILAPTGSGKTLAAFLAIVDRLFRNWSAGVLDRSLKCVYISPLRSLGYDVERSTI